MARRALRKAEDIEKVPEDQDVTLDMSPDDPVVTIEPDIEVVPDKKKPVEKTKDEPELSEREAALKKQLDDLTKAEGIRRTESDRQLREAQERADKLEQQNSQHANSQLEAEYDSVLNAIAAAESESAAASQAYESAAEVGNTKLMSEQQRKIARAEARLESLEQGKYALEGKREAIKNAPKVEKKELPKTDNDRFEAAIANVPDISKNWLRQHPTYITNQRMNIKLQAAHFATEDDGIEPHTPAYIEAIETKLGLKNKAKDDDDDEPEPRRTQVSAPVSRDTPSLDTGRSTPTRVTLNSEERDMAHRARSDLSPGEAERVYAANKLKLIDAKKNGYYSERG